jgi:polysaccharide export outer membrane protein
MNIHRSIFFSGSHCIGGKAAPGNILRAIGIVLYLCTLFVLSSCGSISPAPTRVAPSSPDKDFHVDMPKKVQEYASPEKIDAVTPHENYKYTIGPGDVVNIQVWHRPELSQENTVVSPDGFISVPRVGSLNVLNNTQDEVEKMIIKKLEVLYIKPEVTIRIQEFHNNKAFVLGRVSKPGVINFPGKGTLLEALALAGGIPDNVKETSLTKCSIIRGSDTVIWVNLQDLLNNGNMALNARIMNNDIIYIPEAADEMVYVMGEVMSPGAIQLKSGMSVVKAIMLAGGLNKYANPKNVFVIRQQNIKGDVIQVNVKNLVEHGDFSQNFALMSNDIVFVGSSGMAKFNYTLEKLLPSLQVFSTATTATLLYKTIK